MRTRFADTAQHANAFLFIRAISTMYCVYTPYTSISRVPNPSTNQTPMRWFEVEPVNHYTAQLAAMQLQNVVFKPNV